MTDNITPTQADRDLAGWFLRRMPGDETWRGHVEGLLSRHRLDAIAAQTAEIERLRKLVVSAYQEGWEASVGLHPDDKGMTKDWENSQALNELGTFTTLSAQPNPADDADQYLIRKNGMYYCPNAQGYTSSAAEAGRYTLAEAISHSHPNGPDGPRDGIIYELVPTCAAQPDDQGVGKKEITFAYCCAEGGGDPESCDCVNKNHGTAVLRGSYCNMPNCRNKAPASDPFCSEHRP